GIVRRRIDKSGTLRARVRLVGRVPHSDLAAYYSAADLFVLGSHHEGSGYALIEALACGTTPVVTDIPTFRVLTAGGSMGALWTPGDAGSCGDALVAAASIDRNAQRGRVSDHFNRELSWSAVGRRAMEIYRDVIVHRR